MNWVRACLLSFVIVCYPSSLAMAAIVANGGFEESGQGGLPAGWIAYDWGDPEWLKGRGGARRQDLGGMGVALGNGRT